MQNVNYLITHEKQSHYQGGDGRKGTTMRKSNSHAMILRAAYSRIPEATAQALHAYVYLSNTIVR
jgi:hypothetical protein